MTDVDPRRARSFGAIAAEYDRLRPRTPLEAIRWLLPAPHQRVVDLAAGTGATTEGLLQPALGITEVIAVEPDDRMRAVLAAPVDGRLFFAGEATSPNFFSTAHGARDSGERAAGEVLASPNS